MITHEIALSHPRGSATLDAGERRSDGNANSAYESVVRFLRQGRTGYWSWTRDWLGHCDGFAEAGADMAVSYFSSETGTNQVVGATQAQESK
jgi:hypothetical protein